MQHMSIQVGLLVVNDHQYLESIKDSFCSFGEGGSLGDLSENVPPFWQDPYKCRPFHVDSKCKK